jgi:glutamate-1-semialdehyde aminotransferase
MECIAPLGGVYQAGTLSGNPLAMRAGIEMFKHLRQPDFYSNIFLVSKVKTEHCASLLSLKWNTRFISCSL